MPTLATKTDVERLTGAANVLTGRVSAMDGQLERVTRTVDAKLIGPWQLPAILAACAGVLVAGAALFNWLQVHPWFGLGR